MGFLVDLNSPQAIGVPRLREAPETVRGGIQKVR